MGVVGPEEDRLRGEPAGRGRGQAGADRRYRFRRRYGTEWVLLDEKEGEVVYALRSDTKDLDEYAGQHVRLARFLVEGFSVEAGEPGYISVTRISEAYYSK